MGISVGVDIGGTKILAGIVNDQGQILSKVRKKTPRADASAVPRAPPLHVHRPVPRYCRKN